MIQDISTSDVKSERNTNAPEVDCHVAALGRVGTLEHRVKRLERVLSYLNQRRRRAGPAAA
jgi:hypothetical protein